jgi:1-phosphofructokinase
VSGAPDKRILCVTPNPALDRTLDVPELRIGDTARARGARVAAGGKGVNVARGLAAIRSGSGSENEGEGRPLCMGPLGGASGRILAELAESEGLDAAWTWCEVETRTCVILVGPAGHATVVNEPGPRLAPEDWTRLCGDVLERAKRALAICVSGSVPPGVPAAGLAELGAALVASGHAPWIDSSGPALAGALSTRGVRLKVNRDEASEALGRTLRDVSECAAAARRLLERGPATVVMTLGADGAVLASPAGCWHASAPPVETVSAVGSGDALLAGLVAGLTTGLDEPAALRWGIAAGTANAIAGGGSRFSRDQFDALLVGVRVEARDERGKRISHS